MRRRLEIGGVGLIVLIAGWAIYNYVRNPEMPQERALNARLEQIPASVRPVPDAHKVDLSRLQRAIAAKGALWQPLVAAPPPPKVAPDLKKMLQGVTATRQQIGDKVKLLVPKNPRGEFVGQGDQFNGLLVKTVTPKEVVFSLNQDGQEYTLALPRQ